MQGGDIVKSGMEERDSESAKRGRRRKERENAINSFLGKKRRRRVRKGENFHPLSCFKGPGAIAISITQRILQNPTSEYGNSRRTPAAAFGEKLQK